MYVWVVCWRLAKECVVAMELCLIQRCISHVHKTVQNHYVERSHKVFILNAPSWFSVLWKVCLVQL